MYGRGAVESTTDSHRARRPIPRHDPDQPRHAAARETGLRAIDVMPTCCPHRWATSWRKSYATPATPTGIGGRYLAAVGDRDYETAFWRILRDPQYGHHFRLGASARSRAGWPGDLNRVGGVGAGPLRRGGRARCAPSRGAGVVLSNEDPTMCPATAFSFALQSSP